MMNWCDQQENPIHYLIGIGKNARIEKQAAPLIQFAQKQFEKSRNKQRIFGELSYAAESWKYERRVIVKVEHTSKGKKPRFISYPVDLSLRINLSMLNGVLWILPYDIAELFLPSSAIAT